MTEFTPPPNPGERLPQGPIYHEGSEVSLRGKSISEIFHNLSLLADPRIDPAVCGPAYFRLERGGIRGPVVYVDQETYDNLP
jgi:hypothetical protein